MNTETKKPSEIQALIIRLLPPEEFGEDANVEQLYNLVTDMEAELSEIRKEHKELKPCPFCGGDAKMTQIKNGFMIKCAKCHVQRQQKVLRFKLEWLEGVMIEDWNTRV